jgi:RES domain
VRHVARGDTYVRVVDPSWRDPLTPEHARRGGGRWNPPGAFGVTYLNASRSVARAQVRHKLEPRGIRPEDLDPAAGPVLVRTEVPQDRYVDAVTERGLAALGLPASYPLDADGRVVPQETCRPIGLRAQEAREPGIACRSAARTAPAGGEELAYFGRKRLRAASVERFADWYWSDE